MIIIIVFIGSFHYFIFLLICLNYSYSCFVQLYHQHNYEAATMCFEKAHDIYWERKSRASGLKVLADCTQSSNPEKARSFLREAARTFEDIGMANSAANCFFDLGDYERAGMRIQYPATVNNYFSYVCYCYIQTLACIE